MPSPQGTASVLDQHAYPQWETDLLTGIGAPLSDANYQALALWGASEGTASSNNPLAVSTRFPGATHCIAQCDGSSPVFAYDSMADGVNANISFLQHGYDGIISAFQQDAGLVPIWAAINASSWCKGCQNGHYPNALYQQLNSTPAQITNAVTSAIGALGQAAISPVTGALQAGQSIVSWTTSLASILSWLSNRQNWLRIGEMVLGIALLVSGGLLFLSTTKPGQDVEKVGEVAALA